MPGRPTTLQVAGWAGELAAIGDLSQEPPAAALKFRGPIGPEQWGYDRGEVVEAPGSKWRHMAGNGRRQEGIGNTEISRSGTQQVWTAAVEVRTGGQP
jgi:hypothetical protein